MKKIFIFVLSSLLLINGLFIDYGIYAEENEIVDINEIEEEQVQEIDEEIEEVSDSDIVEEEIVLSQNTYNEELENVQETIVRNEKYNYDSSVVDVYDGSITGDYRYNSTFNSGGKYYTFKYDDSWFIEDESYIYNHDLAIMSLKMAMVGFGSNDKEGDYSYNLRDIYDKLGYTYTDKNRILESQDSEDSLVFPNSWSNFTYFDEANDSIGYGIAYKNVEYENEKYTIVSIVVRGGNYGAEWASDFTTGSDYDFYGFKQAAERIQNKLSDYLDNINSPYKTKIWITGYSRGAATSNLLGYYLDVNAKANKLNHNINPEDIYTYTFESPKGKDNDRATSISYTYSSKTVELENNIFNIVNNADLITKVGMSQLGFSRYGIDKNLPSVVTTKNFYTSDIYNKMVNKYRNILDYGNVYISDDEFIESTVLDINQNAFFNCIVYAMASVFSSGGGDARTTFASPSISNAQNAARLAGADLLSGNSGRELKSIVIYYKYYSGGSLKESKKQEISLADLSSGDRQGIIELGSSILVSLSVSSLVNIENYYVEVWTTDTNNKDISATIKLSESQFNTLKKYAEKVIALATDKSSIVLKLDTLLAHAHYPELCLAWMESSNLSLFKDQKYTRIKVGKTSNTVKVYCGSTVVASLSSDGVSSHQIEAYEDDSEYLIVSIPNDSNYYVEIEAAANPLKDRNVYLNTYNINDGRQLKSASFKIGSEWKNKYIYKIYPYGDSYELYKGSSKQSLSVSTNQDNTDVNIALNYNSNLGTASGGGKYSLYDTVALNASTSAPLYVFDGWYDEKNRLLSEEECYSYIAQYDTTITAKWRKKQYTLRFDKNDLTALGTVDDLVCNYGEACTLPTSTFTKDKYKIESWSIRETGVQVVNNNYVNGTNINVTDGLDGAVVTMSANWKKYIFDINYVIGENVITDNPSTFEYSNSKTITLKDPKYINGYGYVFKGWYDNENYSGNKIESIDCSVEKDYTLYPKFEYKPEEYVAGIVSISGLSAILGDKISINVHIKLIDSSKLSTTKIIYKVLGKQASVDLSSLEKKNNEYILSIELDPKLINKNIDICLQVDGENGKNESYSAKYYFDLLASENSENQKIVDLVQAIENYSEYSNYYFNNINDSEVLSYNQNIKNYNYTIITTKASKNYIKLKNASLVLNSTISIKIYYDIKDGSDINSFDISVKDIDNSRIVKTNKYLLIKDIKVSELLDYFEIVIAKNNVNLVKMNYSPISYVKQVLSLTDTKYNNLKNLMIKTYEYGIKTKEALSN